MRTMGCLRRPATFVAWAAVLALLAVSARADCPDVSDTIALTNRLRDQHVNTEALQWDERLANDANNYANVLANQQGCALNHGAFGENLSQDSRRSYRCSEAVQRWYDERTRYRYQWVPNMYSNNAPQAGHFTQLVWRNTKRFGCGAASSGCGTVVVCRYDPEGNFGTNMDREGSWLDNVMEPKDGVGVSADFQAYAAENRGRTVPELRSGARGGRTPGPAPNPNQGNNNMGPNNMGNNNMGNDNGFVNNMPTNMMPNNIMPNNIGPNNNDLGFTSNLGFNSNPNQGMNNFDIQDNGFGPNNDNFNNFNNMPNNMPNNMGNNMGNNGGGWWWSSGGGGGGGSSSSSSSSSSFSSFSNSFSRRRSSRRRFA